MSLGFVVGESKPSVITVQSSRALPIGEYVIIEVKEGKIVGLVETSFVTSAALSDVRNYDEALESIEIAELNKRDKSYTGKILILGFLEMLRKGKAILPAIPPFPGTRVIKATKADLGEIFAPERNEWLKIGNLLRNQDIDSKINLNKIVSRHLGILAMTGMGKSNLVTLLASKIAALSGTVIIFDYHNDYADLDIPKINVIDAKINPRLLDAETLSEVLEIREGADIQQRILRKAFTTEVRESSSFWETLDQQVQHIGSDPENKVVIMTGTGDVFCAEWGGPGPMRRNPVEWDPVYWNGKKLLLNLLNIEVPMISAINGPALLHAELALLCDIVLASEDAAIQDRHFPRGIVPGDGVHVVWEMLFGVNRGRYFLLTGQKLSANQALELGAVNEVLPKEKLLGRAWELAEQLAEKPTLILRYSRVALTLHLKRMMQDMLGYGLAIEGLGEVQRAQKP